MMIVLSGMVEDHHCSKMGLFLELVGQECGEEWLIQAVRTPCRSDTDADRWCYSIHLHPNKFSERQDRQPLLQVSTLQNRTIIYRWFTTGLVFDSNSCVLS